MPTKWTGKILKKADLRSMRERQLLRDSDNKAVILPYGNFDAARRPALLIHGAGNPGILRDVASRLHKGGLQVWFVFYDDLGVAPHSNGRRIASELSKLRQAYYAASVELDVVAHSIGGIVARCMLNDLQNPKWRTDEPSVGPARAGFTHVRVRTIDTPWSGFGSKDMEKYTDDSKGTRFVLAVMRSLGVGGAFEMGAGSLTLRHLFIDLDKVELQNLVARRRSNIKDWIPSLPESTPKRAQSIARCIAMGEKPKKLKQRNICFGLRQDSRFGTLRTLVQRGVVNDELDLEGRATRTLVRRLTALHDKAMPRFKGSHIRVILDKEDDAKDLVDYLVKELCPEP